MRFLIDFKILIICLFNCLAIHILNGQVLNFEQLTSKDGLPATECYHIIQDKKEYIWVFSEYGIVKHNGKQFVPVCINIPLKDQNAYAVFQSENGDVYFANSFCKIFQIRNDSAFSIKAIEKFTSGLTKPDDLIFQIIVDKNGDIYFSSYKASYCYRLKTNKVETIPARQNDRKKSVYHLYNNHFLSMRTFPLREEETDVEIHDGDRVISSKLNIESFYETRSLRKVRNAYILMTSNTMHKISENGSVQSKKIKGCVNFTVDSADQIWLGTNEGLLLLDSNLTILSSYLEGKVISNICFDNKGGIWTTTIGQGVYYCKNKEEIAYENTDLKRNEIFFFKKEKENIYLASKDGACYQFQKNEFRLLHDFNGPFFCGDITAYREGFLFSTKRGLFYKKGSGSFEEITDLNKGPLYSNYAEVLNENEFLSFGGTAIYHFRNNKIFRTWTVKYKIYCITPSGQNEYIIGTKNGIFLYDPDADTIKNYNSFFDNKFIMSMTYDKHGNLWVGTRGDGLYAITKENKVIQYSNVPFYVVKDIDFFDDNGVVVSTNLGVYINSQRETHIVGDWINIFDYEINSVEVVDRNLWIASRNGLYSMSFSNLVTNDFYPIIINSVYSGSRRVLDHSSELNYNENDLRFNLDFLNYRSEVKNFYFRLEGPTKLSGTISGNVLQIQNLDPGIYKLYVYPYHGPMYSNKHLITTSFTIKPAFWQTYWFKPGVFILAILISGFTVALFYNSKRKRDRKKADINKLLAEYKLTALKAQINPHFISNSLSAIQLLIDSGMVDKANQYIAKFSLMIRYVLNYSDKSFSRLSDELKIIELNVELEQLRFTNSFTFMMDVASDIDINELYVPPLITQPFIENAIWHGLIPLTSRTPQLILKIKRQDDSLIISIIDNGVGRKRVDKNTPITNSGFRESMGTKLIQNRIDNLNEMYNTKAAEVLITDLHDDQMNSTGTRVDIILSVSLLSNY